MQQATHGVRLLREGVNEDPKQLVRVIDLVRVLADDPYQGRFSFGFV